MASGQTTPRLAELLQGQDVGTYFWPQPSKDGARAVWLRHAVKPRGALWLDAGAVAAVVERKKSVLPAGVRKVVGAFSRGDPVELKSPQGVVIARGLTAYGADDLRRIVGLKGSEIAKVLGAHDSDDSRVSSVRRQT